MALPKKSKRDAGNHTGGSWQLQDAKNSLSEVVNRALTEGAQTITRHGKPVVVVVSQEEFQKVMPPPKKTFDLLSHLLACPEKNLQKLVGTTRGVAKDIDL